MPEQSPAEDSQNSVPAAEQGRPLFGALEALGIRSRANLGFVLLLLALGVGSAWTFLHVRDSLLNIHGATLVALLDTESAAMARELAPVRGDGREKARLAGSVSDTLRAARFGKSGEAYAFDERGAMLTESRFAEDLRRLGLLPRDPSSAALRVELRDPGGDLVEGFQPETTLSERPYTRLVAAALASRDAGAEEQRRGVFLAPYRNYLGVEVIGAWRWLAQPGVGVAVEVSADEAFRPLEAFHLSFALMLGALLLLWLAAYTSPETWVRYLNRPDPHQAGPYRLLRRIGEGGMSNVYLAKHAYLTRPTAVKVLKPHAATDEMIARFSREVQLASQLRHPNTIRIYDYGRTFSGLFYYAMEHLEGLSVGALVERFGPLPPSRTAYILKQVCGALAEMHERGLVHRDIKPENIMLCRLGGDADVVKVVDFGLVKDVMSRATRDLTRSVRILGTPLYMAPERIRNPGDVDARADLYALGAVAFLMLTGRRLFESANDLDLTNQVLNAPASRPSEAAGGGIPPGLDDLVVCCLAKDRDARPASADQVAAVLDAVLAQDPWTPELANGWWDANLGPLHS